MVVIAAVVVVENPPAAVVGVAATVDETERWLLVQVVISSVDVRRLYILAD